MRQLLLFIVGLCVGYAVGYFLVAIFAHWYEPRFVKSDDDIGVAYFYSLIFLGVVSVCGGVVALKFAKRP
jgi:hypothetical protein